MELSYQECFSQQLWASPKAVQSNNFLVSTTTSGVLLILDSSSSPIPLLMCQLPTLFSRPCKGTCFLRSSPSKSCLCTPPADRLVGVTYHWALCTYRPLKHVTKTEMSKYRVWCYLVFLWGNSLYFLPLTVVKRWGKKGCHVIFTKIFLPRCLYHECIYCLITKLYLADKSFHESHRIHSGKCMVWMPVAPITSHLGKGKELMNTEINLTVTLREFGQFHGLPNGYRGTFCTGISYNLTVCYLNKK